MTETKENTKYVPYFPILPVLGVIFITLKLTGYIAWSWLWVLAPFWVPITLAISIFLLFVIIGLIIAVVKALLRK